MKQATSSCVGYIGLGIMGSAMAGRLLGAVYELIVHNRTMSRCDELLALGATAAASPAELAAMSPSVIFVNVTDTPDVEQVLLGEAGIAKAAKPGLIVVDQSTISPNATRRMAETLSTRGVTLIDAPVSGGDVGAREGTLSIMVGGDEAAYERVLPLLGHMGKRITYLGGSGNGQACKACNQIAVAGALMGVVEALGLAKRLGLDLNQAIEVIAGGAAGSWQMSNLGPRVAEGDHEPGFMIDLIVKDLSIVLDAAASQGLPLAGTAEAMRYFEQARESGQGQKGTQGIAAVLEQRGGFRFIDP